jgi:site-specific recombinase
LNTPRDLPGLLADLDPHAGLAQRHLWLIGLLDWIRGDCTSAPAAVARLQLLLDAIQADPQAQARWLAWWARLAASVDATTLLADFGFAQRTAFISEFGERLRYKLLPGTPETNDSAELFALTFPFAFDAQWLALLDGPTLQRLGALLVLPRADGLTQWQYVLLEAITYCASQIRATGFAPELRLRMSDTALDQQPFHALASDLDRLRAAFMQGPADGGVLAGAVQQFKERLEACRQAATSVYSHLEDNGVSIGLVFRLRQLRERVLRIRELLDCLLSEHADTSAARLTAHLVLVGQERSSLRALISSNTSLLAAKMAERSAETGEHYITRDRPEYHSMLRKAAGGGALTALTVWMKFAVAALSLSVFWGGFWSSMGYAVSFVAIQLLHCTLATKQPAMTAPAMAAKLKELESEHAIAGFVDEVSHLVRSQVAAVIGNVSVVFPCVVVMSWMLQQASGHTMIDAKEAAHVLHSLSLLGPTVLFAAITGVALFASSIIAGWTENWFVLHRLDSAMRYNPRITSALGAQRALRWSVFMRENISGFASNISLGFILGLLPAIASFFGLGLEFRHITLSTGQLGAATAQIGWPVLSQSAFWWCVAALPFMATLNVGVSFYLAFRLALRAHNVVDAQRKQIGRAVRQRFLHAPLSFFWPPREAAKSAHG